MGDFFKKPGNQFNSTTKALPPHMAFFTKLRRIVKYYKQFCLAKATESRLEESRLRQHLDFWQVTLHSNTTNGTTKARIKILRDKLQSLANKKDEGRKIN
jgi:hypothetical protein